MNSLTTIWIILCTIMLSVNLIKAQSIAADYQSFDGNNVILFGCDYQEAETRMYINVVNVKGGSGKYRINTSGNCAVSSKEIAAGQGFTFYFTEQDQANGLINFTIIDKSNSNNIYTLNPLVKTQIELLQFFVCNAPSYRCRNTIVHPNSPVPVSEYNTIDYIKSSGIIISPSTATTYLSSTLIELNNGFEVPVNSGFTADIKNCNP